MAVVVITLWYTRSFKTWAHGGNEPETYWGRPLPGHPNIRTLTRGISLILPYCAWQWLGVVKRIHGLSLVHEKVTITLRARGQSENTANALGSFNGGSNWPFTLYEEPKSSGKAGKYDLCQRHCCETVIYGGIAVEMGQLSLSRNTQLCGGVISYQ